MRINYNAAAMRANHSLNASDKKVSKALERLSSGLKLTAPKDNPAGYAIARRMNAQIEGLGIATKDSNNGISIVEIADGALTEVHEMLQRMNELAVKGETGTLTTSDRKMIQAEIKQLKEEIERISTDTEFNGQPLLEGSFDLKGYTDNLSAKVDYYSDEVVPKTYTINSLHVEYDADGKIPLDKCRFVAGKGFPQGAELSSVSEDAITITGPQGFELTLGINTPRTVGTDGKMAYSPLNATNMEVEITGIGAMDVQTGSNEGQQLKIRIPEVSLHRLGIERVDTSTVEGSADANKAVKGAILYVSDVRSRLGAYQNRLEHTVNNLAVSTENMTASYSRIMDADIAEEMTNYTTEQVISQAATSMLAQANERPSQVLQLLQ